MLNLVLFGPPGAGKGTQSEKIIKKYNLIHISTGDLFRIHLSEGTSLGKQAQKFMDEGELVPDEVVIGMVEEKINSVSSANGFIFDGFPRTVDQAKALDQLLNDMNETISGMVLLKVDEQELISRIQLRAKSSGRSDDTDISKIQNRIKVYKTETLPVAEYYEQQCKLHKVKGVGSINEIFGNICDVIDTLPR